MHAFFVISGLTLSQSLMRRPDLVHYAWARFLRIFPALFAYGIVFAFVAGPLLTSFQSLDYFADAHTWLYPLAVLVQFARAIPPHGILTGAPFSEAANDPLWTIKYEIVAYIGLAGLHYFRVLRSAPVLLASLAIALATFLVAHSVPDEPGGTTWVYQLGRCTFCFLLGVLAHRFKDWLSLSPRLLVLSGAVVLIAAGTRFEATAYIVLVAHLVLIAGAQYYGLLTIYSRRSDLSYGTYIYGWPVQQSIMVLFPAIGIAGLLLWSLAIVPFFAYASWNLIEKPAMRLKHLDPRMLLLVRRWS